MKKVRTIFYIIAIVSAILAGYLSFQTDYSTIRSDWYKSNELLDKGEPNSVSNSIDSGKDGGAAGFAVLSGLSLIAASITYLKNDGD